MALPVTDNFTGSNGTALTTYSSSWSINAGDFAIQGNALAANGATSTTESAARRNDEAFPPNQYAQATISAKGAVLNAKIGVGVRIATDGSANYYGIYYDDDSGDVLMFKVVGGTWTQLGAAFNGTLAVGTIIRLEIKGTTLEYFRDTGAGFVSQGTRTDSDLSSGAAGVVGRGLTTGQTIDDFSAGTFGSAAVSGTATTGITKADLTGTDKTIIAVLTGETYVASSFQAQIGYVGGQVGGRAGSTSTSNVNFALSGGDAGIASSTPQAGDLVVITVVVGSQARNPACAISGYTAIGQLNSAAATQDTSMNVSYKLMGGTPDTSFTLPSTGNVQDAQRYTVQVFRNVNSTTPLDVTPVSATGSGTGRPDPGSITPLTSGAYVLICAGGGAGTGANYTAPANYTTNFLTGFTADTNDAMVGSGYRAWTSGAENPAVYTGGTTNATDSWCAYTIALRPVPATTPFADARQDFINGWVSAQSEATGWNNVVPPNIPVANVVRTADDTVTMTIPHSAISSYNITAQEVVTGTIPGSILTGGSFITASPSFTIDPGSSFSPSDDSGDWWVGALNCMAKVAIAGALATNALAAQLPYARNLDYDPVPVAIEDYSHNLNILTPPISSYGKKATQAFTADDDIATPPVSTIVKDEWLPPTPQWVARAPVQAITADDEIVIPSIDITGGGNGSLSLLSLRYWFVDDEVVPQPTPLPIGEEAWVLQPTATRVLTNFSSVITATDEIPSSPIDGEWAIPQPHPQASPVRVFTQTEDELPIVPPQTIAEEAYWLRPNYVLSSAPVTAFIQLEDDFVSPPATSDSGAGVGSTSLLSLRYWFVDDEIVPQPQPLPVDEDYWPLQSQLLKGINNLNSVITATDEVVPQPPSLSIDEDFWPLQPQIVQGVNNFNRIIADTDEVPTTPPPIALDENYWLSFPIQPVPVVPRAFIQLEDDFAVAQILGPGGGNGSLSLLSLRYWYTDDEIVPPPVPLHIEQDIWGGKLLSLSPAPKVPVQAYIDEDLIVPQPIPLPVDELYWFIPKSVPVVLPPIQAIVADNEIVPQPIILGIDDESPALYRPRIVYETIYWISDEGMAPQSNPAATQITFDDDAGWQPPVETVTTVIAGLWADERIFFVGVADGEQGLIPTGNPVVQPPPRQAFTADDEIVPQPIPLPVDEEYWLIVRPVGEILPPVQAIVADNEIVPQPIPLPVDEAYWTNLKDVPVVTPPIVAFSDDDLVLPGPPPFVPLGVDDETHPVSVPGVENTIIYWISDEGMAPNSNPATTSLSSDDDAGWMPPIETVSTVIAGLWSDDDILEFPLGMDDLAGWVPNIVSIPKPPVQAMLDEDLIVPQPIPLPITEDYWLLPRPVPGILPPIQAFSDEDLIVPQPNPTEPGYHLVLNETPVITPPVQAFTADDEVVSPLTVAEEYWVIPTSVPMVLPPLQAISADDETFRVGQPDEDFWINPVAPVPAKNTYPQPYSFDQHERYRTPTFEDDSMGVYVAPLFKPPVLPFVADDNQVPLVPIAVDEDFYLPPEPQPSRSFITLFRETGIDDRVKHKKKIPWHINTGTTEIAPTTQDTAQGIKPKDSGTGGDTILPLYDDGVDSEN